MADYVTLHGDAHELLCSLPDDSVDMVLTDPPYGELHIDWDRPGQLNLPMIMRELRRVIRPRGAMLFFFVHAVRGRAYQRSAGFVPL